MIILFLFAKWIVNLTYLLVTDKGLEEKKEDFQLEYIGPSSVFSPNTAVAEVTKELERMGNMAVENLNKDMKVLIKQDDKVIQEVYETEQQINYMNRAITNYLVGISQSTLPIDNMKNIGGLFHVVNDIERIGDHAENVADAAVLRKEKISKNNKEHLQEILDLENGIDQMERAADHATNIAFSVLDEESKEEKRQNMENVIQSIN